MTDYLNTDPNDISVTEAADAIRWLQNDVVQTTTAAINKGTADADALAAANAKIAALQGQAVAAAYPAPQKVQVLHRQPSITVPMNILNVENTGEMLTVYVN